MIKHCKANQVTVNSFIGTLINFAFLNHAECSNDEKKFISGYHAVNLRTDFNPDMAEQPGCLMSSLEDSCHLSNRDDFWTKTQEFHHRFRNNLNVRKCQWKLLPLIPLFCPTNFIKPLRTYDYYLTNLGRLDDRIQERNSGIKVTKLVRQTLLNEYPFPTILLGCHSLCNKFSIYCNFPTYRVNEHEGKLVFNNICKAIKNVSNQGTLRLKQ